MDPASSGFIGRVVAGRYRILAKLGEGGMGAVYRAEQISLKRIVALKVLRAELSAEPGLVRRFNTEAELAAKLSHPNTVTLFDFGQDADGSLFIAMEYLEGRSLREVLSHEGPLAPGRALAICEQLCASLADAHARGIVHRDLKPDNVMLLQRGRLADVVRVLDFGIAKLRDEQADVANRPMTRAGDLLGTPQYMAPEQIRGETVDARTDVYALGAMLYEMVTGRLPFEGPSLMAILSKHLTEMPLPPRERRPDLCISPSLGQLVMEALDKDPTRRPPSMDAFADRLARLVLEVGPGTGAPAMAGFPAVGGGFLPAPALPLPDSPPPGVPMLRTPVPGSLPSPYPSPVPPTSAAATPSPSPFVHSTPAPPSYQSPPPGYAAPSPPPSHGGPAQLAVAAGPSAAGRAGIWLAGILIAAGAAVAVYFAARGGGGDQPPPSPGPSYGPAVQPDSHQPGAVAPDFSVQPERRLYGDGDDDDGMAPPPPSIPGQQVWQGGWWKSASGGLQIDIPSGFAIAGADAAAVFSGQCGGADCTITAVSSPTYGVEMDDATIAQYVARMPVASGHGGGASTIRVHGRDRYSIVVDNAGQRGQLVVFAGAGNLSVVVIHVPRSAFDQTAAFRKAFFEQRVRVP